MILKIGKGCWYFLIVLIVFPFFPSNRSLGAATGGGTAGTIGLFSSRGGGGQHGSKAKMASLLFIRQLSGSFSSTVKHSAEAGCIALPVY